MPRLLWLADVLRADGLDVREVDGWESRGAATMNPFGVGAHHTAGPATGDYPSLGVVRDGRGGANPLPGPLSQLGLGRSGLWYVIASGKANHAGKGAWRGVSTSTAWIGVEAEHVGRTGVPWPSVQLDAYDAGCAAVLRHLGRDAGWLWGHKEYATPKGRKVDPIDLSMEAMRVRVQRLIDGNPAKPAPLEEAEMFIGRAGGKWWLYLPHGKRVLLTDAERDRYTKDGVRNLGDVPNAVYEAFVQVG